MQDDTELDYAGGRNIGNFMGARGRNIGLYVGHKNAQGPGGRNYNIRYTGNEAWGRNTGNNNNMAGHGDGWEWGLGGQGRGKLSSSRSGPEVPPKSATQVKNHFSL